MLQPADHRTDTDRPRDPLELRDADLTALIQTPHSESRDALIEHLTEPIDTREDVAEVPKESHEEAIERKLLERAALNRQIKDLKKTAPESPRIAELQAERDAVQREIDVSRRAQRSGEGAAPAKKDDRTRQKYETQSATERKALEGAERERAKLERRPPTSEVEQAAFAARKAELAQQIPVLEKSLRRTRRQLAAPGAREKKRAYDKALRGRPLQTRTHRADTTRPRDPLELLEAELAGLLQTHPSESRDTRIQHLTERIDTMKQLVELRRERARIKGKLSRTRSARDELSAIGGDTRELDGRLEQLGLQMRAVRIEIAQLRVREHFLALLDETPWAHAPGFVDEAQLREFERQLAEGAVNEQQLAGIEQALDAMDPTPADLQEAVLDEADDVDEVLSEREELLQQRLSPERAARLQASFERLQKELREARVAVDAAVASLANQYAFIEQTGASSSSGPTWRERLRAIHQEQLDLQENWRASLRARLGSAREQIDLMRRIPRFRDEAREAELAREIALLEGELQKAGG
jgi:hypothetical protein